MNTPGKMGTLLNIFLLDKVCLDRGHIECNSGKKVPKSNKIIFRELWFFNMHLPKVMDLRTLLTINL